MLFESFCSELEKLANPNILKYLDTYRPEAARSAIFKEYEMLKASLDNDKIEEPVKNAIRRRIDDLNRAEYLVGTFESSLKKNGKKFSAEKHLVGGLNKHLASITSQTRADLAKQVMEGKLTQQQAEIVIKNKLRSIVPDGLNKKYVEDFGANLGVLPSDAHIDKTLDRAILSKSLRPNDIEADSKYLTLFPDLLDNKPSEEASCNRGTRITCCRG